MNQFLEDLADGLEACVDLLNTENPAMIRVVAASLPLYSQRIREYVAQQEKVDDRSSD